MSPGIIFLIVIAVFGGIGTLIYLIVNIAYRQEIKNFRVKNKPEAITFKYHVSDKTIFTNIPQLGDLFSNYYNALVLEDYYKKEIPRVDAIIKKCKTALAKKDEERFNKVSIDLHSGHYTHKKVLEDTAQELKDFFSANINRTALASFPKKIISIMIENGSQDIVATKLNELSGCLSVLENHKYYLFTPTCVLTFEPGKKSYSDILYPELNLIKTESTESSMSKYGREVVRTTWRYQRRDGGPDLRYNGNYATYIVNVYRLSLKFFSFKQSWTLYLKEEVNKIEKPVNEYNQYLKFINNTSVDKETMEQSLSYYEKTKPFLKYFSISSTGVLSLAYGIRYSSDVPSNLDVYIPENVTKIDTGAFESFEKMRSIHIPASVKEISNSAFERCYNLEAVYFEGNNLVKIGARAFYCCSRLKMFTLPKSVKFIGNDAFLDCKQLDNIGFGKGIVELNDKIEYEDISSFFGTKLKSLLLNTKHVEKITKTFAFDKLLIRSDIDIDTYKALVIHLDFDSIEMGIKKVDTLPKKTGELNGVEFTRSHVVLPPCVTSIGSCRINSLVQTIYVSSEMVSISDDFFFPLYGASLREVTLPSHLKDRISVPKYVEVTYYKTSLVIPDCLTITKDNYKDIPYHQYKFAKEIIIKDIFNELKTTLQDCENLKKLTIDIQTKEIPNDLLINNEDIEEVICSNSVTTIGDNAFSGCKKLKSFKADNIIIIGHNAFKNASLKDVDFINKVTSLGNYAFSNNKAIKVASIKEATTLGEGVFQNCQSLLECHLHSSINEVPPHFFEGCKELNKIDANIKGVKEYGLSGCENVNYESLIPKLEVINPHAFENNKLIKKLKINEKVKEIGDYAFNGCSNVKSIDVKPKTKLGDYCFAGTGIEDISFIASGTKLKSGLFANCVNIKEIKIPYGYKSLPSSLFEGCTNLVSVYIPDSVTSLGSHAFYGCTSLNDITGMAELTSIGFEAFGKCDSLTKLIFPTSLEECLDPIPSCKKIKELVITSNLKKLSFTLGGCKNLKKVYVPLEVGDFNLKDEYDIRNKNIEFCAIRGSSWLRKYKYIKINYIPKDEYQIMINRFLLECGYQILNTGKKVEMNEKYFGKFDAKFKFDVDDIPYEVEDDKPVEKKRAGFNTTTVKEEDKSKASKTKQKENKGYVVSIYEGEIPNNLLSINEEKQKELFKSEDTIVSGIYTSIYQSNSDFDSVYSFIISKEKLISNIIKIEKIRKDEKMVYNLDIDGSAEGKAYIVVVNNDYSIISSKKLYIDRAYNIDSLLNF